MIDTQNAKSVDEAEKYQKTYRLIFDNDTVKAYNEKTKILIDESVGFDSQKETFTALDHCIASIVSEILLCIHKQAELEHETIMDLESRTTLDIKNPLTLLNVIGYDEIPYIERVTVKIYAYSFLEKAEALKLFERALKKCVLYNSVKDALQFQVLFDLSI